MLESLSIVLYLVITLAVPTLAIWGWVRWARSVQPRTPSSTISLAGFALSNVSAALAIATAVYAQVSGGFRYYDPVLINIYGIGLLLSLGGLACGLIGPAQAQSSALACSCLLRGHVCVLAALGRARIALKIFLNRGATPPNLVT